MSHTFDSEVSLHYWMLWPTMWHPQDITMPSTFQHLKAEVQGFHMKVSFVSLLLMVTSEYWKMTGGKNTLSFWQNSVVKMNYLPHSIDLDLVQSIVHSKYFMEIDSNNQNFHYSEFHNHLQNPTCIFLSVRAKVNKKHFALGHPVGAKSLLS